MKDTIIIGAGITGLSVAVHLKKLCVILEKETTPGGLCRSARKDGFTFDYSGHFIHFHRDETFAIVNSLLKGKLAKVKRSAWIHTHGSWVPYPFQANLYALPEKIRKECVEGFLKRPLLKTHNSILSTSFYDWSLQTFGSGITKHFMRPYNEKLWTVPAKKLTAEWCGPFVPTPQVQEIMDGASEERNKDFGYNVFFYYPQTGGIQTLIDAFAVKTGGIRTGAEAAEIDFRKRTLKTKTGERYDYDTLVSTQPLPRLLDSIKELPPEIASARAKLAWNSVTCLNAAVRSTSALEDMDSKHWIYFPEKKFRFYRAGIYTNILEGMAPEGYASMYIEVSRGPRERADRKEIARAALSGLKRAGLIKGNAGFEAQEWMDIPCAYVIFDRNHAEATSVIHNFLKQNGIYSAGRYGDWKYSFMEESISDGMKLADKLNGAP